MLLSTMATKKPSAVMLILLIAGTAIASPLRVQEEKIEGNIQASSITSGSEVQTNAKFVMDVQCILHNPADPLYAYNSKVNPEQRCAGAASFVAEACATIDLIFVDPQEYCLIGGAGAAP